jgi:hypothetical protein
MLLWHQVDPGLACNTGKDEIISAEKGKQSLREKLGNSYPLSSLVALSAANSIIPSLISSPRRLKSNLVQLSGILFWSPSPARGRGETLALSKIVSSPVHILR